MGDCFVVFLFRLSPGTADVRCAGSAACLCLSSLPRCRAARLSCGLTVRHARLSTAASPVTSSRLCPSWSSGFRVLPSSVTQRESSPARAHDTIGAGRVKRLLGARFRRRVVVSSSGAADAQFARSALRSCLSSLSLHRTARVSCGLTVRRARLTTAASPVTASRLCRS